VESVRVGFENPLPASNLFSALNVDGIHVLRSFVADNMIRRAKTHLNWLASVMTSLRWRGLHAVLDGSETGKTGV
jgi:hypothetical protein